MSSISPTLPVVVTACCSDVDVFVFVYVNVYLIAPSISFTGAINLNGTTD
ncbi:MAG: hypothetical protein ACYCPW_07665 [Nitrososphaerales archaeon]